MRVQYQKNYGPYYICKQFKHSKKNTRRANFSGLLILGTKKDYHQVLKP